MIEKENNKKKSQKLLNRTWLHSLLHRYLSDGQITEKEKEVIEKWMPDIEKIKKNKELERIMEEDRKIIWEKLAFRYGFDKIEKAQHIRPASGMKIIPLFRKYAAVAAVLLLLTGTVFYFTSDQNLFSNMVTAETFYQTGDSETKRIVLTDGSTVHLNANTRLALNEAGFNKKKREIRLEEGEAFFDVAKNPDKPFIVHSRHLLTTVRGTSFNVKAYKELEGDVVTVKTGKVEVETETEISRTLTRNQQVAFYAAGKRLVSDEVNTDAVAAWTEGRLVLVKADVNELKLRLKQLFGVELEFTSGLPGDVLFHAAYPSGVSLDTVMEDICIVYGLSYEKTENRLTLSRNS